MIPVDLGSKGKGQEFGKMINILHIVQTFGIGGMENRVARLARGLSDQGYQITILTLRPTMGRQPTLPSQVKLEYFEIKSGLHFARIFSLARFIKAGGFQIVHTHNWSTMLYGILAGKLARVPVVIHGEHGINMEELGGIPWKRLFAQKLLARLCNRLIAVHNHMAANIRDTWGQASSRVVSIPNGVDLSRFSSQNFADPSKFVVGTVGRLDPVKNFPCLLKAFAILKSKHSDNSNMHLVFVGEGPAKRFLESNAIELGLGSEVSFSGDISEPEKMYSQFSIFVNCSLSEGMSNTILEAMASGLPMAVSRIDGNTSWISAGTNALFFDPMDPADLAGQLEILLADPGLRTRMGHENRKRAESEFDNRLFIENYKSLYQELLAHRFKISRPGF